MTKLTPKIRIISTALVVITLAVIAGCAGAPLVAARSSSPPERPWLGLRNGPCSAEAHHAAVLSRGDAGAVQSAVRVCVRARAARPL